jgi:hypothetical protein
MVATIESESGLKGSRWSQGVVVALTVLGPGRERLSLSRLTIRPIRTLRDAKVKPLSLKNRCVSHSCSIRQKLASKSGIPSWQDNERIQAKVDVVRAGKVPIAGAENSHSPEPRVYFERLEVRESVPRMSRA